MIDTPQDAAPRRKVLAVAQRPSDFTEMRRCAIELHKRGYAAQLLYFCIGDITAEAAVVADIRKLHADGVLADIEIVNEIGPSGSDAGATETVHFHQKLPKFLRDPYVYVRTEANKLKKKIYYPIALFFRLVGVCARVLYSLKLYSSNLTDVRNVLDQFKPDVIVLPEDVVGAVTPIVIKAGHERNIASVILPYTIANQQEAFRSLQALPNYQYAFFPNRVMGIFFPRWVMKQGGTKLVRLPAPHILAHVIQRIQPPDPWMMNSGFANIIAVENEAMWDYYRQSGIPESKLKVVGAFYDDYLAKFTLNRERELELLREELEIDNSKPLLLVGGCPDQSHNSPAFEFEDMEAFCRRLGEALRLVQDDYEIIVRPHPNYYRMGDILAESGAKLTLIDTARLVGLCDLYVAFASATIRWAIACAKPTINYDVFCYHYDDFESVDGVAHVRDMDAFETLLQETRPGSEAVAKLHGKIAIDAPRWGRLDGKAGDRIEGLIEDYSRMKSIPRTSR